MESTNVYSPDIRAENFASTPAFQDKMINHTFKAREPFGQINTNDSPKKHLRNANKPTSPWKPRQNINDENGFHGEKSKQKKLESTAQPFAEVTAIENQKSQQSEALTLK
jgi:hypothetical protein